MMINGPVVGTVGSVGSVEGVVAVSERLVALHSELKRIVKARAHLDVQEAEALREAQKLQLWKQFGHTSLVDYMVQELGYSSWRTAEDRLRLANALPELPKLTEALQSGNLNASQAREIARVATPQTEEKWIAKALDLNVREVEQAVAGHCKGDLPEDAVDPRLVRKTLWLSVRPETEVLFREVRKQLDKVRGEKLDDDGVLEALCRAYLNRADRSESTHVGANGAQREDLDGVRMSTASANAASANAASANAASAHAASANAAAAPYRVAVTVCTACKRGWQHGGGAVVEMTPPGVETAQCDAQWIGDLDSDEVERAYQEIPPATRRKVLHRDHERCRVPGCGAHNNLDVHHIVHREHGGTNELSNLITACEAHHLAHHAGTLVIERVGGEVVFRREGRNRFTRVTREVETKRALHARGFDTARVKEIMARTITEIGENDISAHQWLAIALRYAEQLAGSGRSPD